MGWKKQAEEWNYQRGSDTDAELRARIKKGIGISPLDGEFVEYCGDDVIPVTKYKCPKCGRFSDKMKLLDIRYEPNAKEIREFPNVAGELFECKCGKVLRWVQMEKVIEEMKIDGKV